MSDLTDFLLARIAEDEAVARRVASLPRWLMWGDMPNAAEGVEDFIVRNYPARALAECEAKRRVVELHHPDGHLENWYWLERKCAECGRTWHKWLPNKKPTDIGPEQGCPTLRLLASVYADHPDFREEWR